MPIWWLRPRHCLAASAGKIVALRLSDGPARGRLFLSGPGLLHPSSTLAIWLAAVIGLQYLAYPGLAGLAGLLLLTGARPAAWFGYIRRARWLLLTLWLILAYNTPGEALADLSWAPTYEGMAEANLHAVRLLLMLGCLAWLFGRLGRDGLVSGLWGVLAPWRALGLDTGRLVVRLSLVLEHLQAPPVRGAWRQMLAAEPAWLDAPASIQLSLPRWRLRDVLAPLGVVALLLAGVWL